MNRIHHHSSRHSSNRSCSNQNHNHCSPSYSCHHSLYRQPAAADRVLRPPHRLRQSARATRDASHAPTRPLRQCAPPRRSLPADESRWRVQASRGPTIVSAQFLFATLCGGDGSCLRRGPALAPPRAGRTPGRGYPERMPSIAPTPTPSRPFAARSIDQAGPNPPPDRSQAPPAREAQAVGA